MTVGALQRPGTGAARASLDSRGLRAAARAIMPVVTFGLVPAVVATLVMASAIRHGYGFDFRELWTAGRAVLHHRSPYPPPAEVAHARPLTAYGFFALPAPVAVALTPLALLPFGAAAAVATLILAGCFVAALRLLGVRDWRCYGLAAGCLPVLSSLRLGAVTPILVLLLAVAWRYRGRPLVAGIAVGLAIVAKLFVWPAVVWLLLTRRFRASSAAALTAGIVTAVAWAAIGFRGLADYPTLLRSLARLEAPQGFSPAAAAARLHLPPTTLAWVLLVLPVAALLLVFALRASPGEERDRRLFATAVVLSLLLTPILWLHYFALLLVPVGIAAPRFGARWLILLAFWVTPWTNPTHYALWRIVFALAVAALATRPLTRAGRPAAAGRLQVPGGQARDRLAAALRAGPLRTLPRA